MGYLIFKDDENWILVILIGGEWKTQEYTKRSRDYETREFASAQEAFDYAIINMEKIYE